MENKLTIIENGEEYELNSLKELVFTLLGEDFIRLDKKEQIKRMRIKATANCLYNNYDIVENLNISNIDDLDNKFIIKNEVTYILSLLLTTNIVIIEKNDAGIFTKYINKEEIKDDYTIINAYAKELLYKVVKSWHKLQTVVK